MVAPECFLPRNNRENFTMDFAVKLCKLSKRWKITEKKKKRNIYIDCLMIISLMHIFFTIYQATGSMFQFYSVKVVIFCKN